MMKKPRDISASDWRHLEQHLDKLPKDKLTALYEACENLAPTAQIKLLKKAADRAQEMWEAEEGAGKVKPRRFAKRQGEEKMEDCE